MKSATNEGSLCECVCVRACMYMCVCVCVCIKLALRKCKDPKRKENTLGKYSWRKGLVKRNEKRGYSRNLMGTAKHGEVCLGAKRKRLGRVVGTRWRRKSMPQLEK